MEIHIIVSIIIVFLVIIISTFVLFNDVKSNINRLFFFLCFSIILWIVSNILAHVSNEYDSAIFFTRIALIWTSLLPLFFNALIKKLYFEDSQDYKRIYEIMLILSLAVIFFFVLFNSTHLNIISISMKDYGLDFEPGIFYHILFVYLLISFGFSFLSLLRIIRESIQTHKSQAKIILFGSFTTVILSVILDIILPVYGYSSMTVYAPLTILFFVFSIGFAITKHHLFNIKIIAAEIIISVLWIFILLHLLLNNNSIEKIIFGISILIISLIFGIVFIRSILHNTEQNKKIEKLTLDLSKAYEDIRKSQD